MNIELGNNVRLCEIPTNNPLQHNLIISQTKRKFVIGPPIS